MKITFVGPLISTFVKNDITILRQEHELDIIDSAIGRGWRAGVNLVVLQLRIAASMLSRDALYFWFADYHTLCTSIIARMLGKKVFVVVGGFEIENLPDLGVGARTRRWRWFAVKHTLQFATHLFPVSNDTQHEVDIQIPHHSKSTVIYNAVDTARFKYDGREKKQIALTVSQADAVADYELKQMGLFLELAREMPECEFRIVGLRGAAQEKALADASEIPNAVAIEGPLPPMGLVEEFQNAAAYCQFSLVESFGLAVAEAMNSGCVPIVAPVPALQEVVGNLGYTKERADKQGLLDALRSSMSAPLEERLKIMRLGARFDISVRAHKLLESIQTAL